MLPALFLDRDGVIIENRQRYVRSWADVDIFPQALRALERVAALPFKVVIITNQSAVGRGLISLAEAHAINERLVDQITSTGGRVDSVYLCPHKPSDACSCRKPEPGMFFQVRDDFDIKLGRSIMIGDALTDLQAGHAAGIKKLALVRTGRGASQQILARRVRSIPVTVYENLEEAVNQLLLAP